MKVTRRRLAGLAAGAAAIAAAQTAPAPGPEEDLRTARENVKRNAEALEKFKVPIETEPAFQFRA